MSRVINTSSLEGVASCRPCNQSYKQRLFGRREQKSTAGQLLLEVALFAAENKALSNPCDRGAQGRARSHLLRVEQLARLRRAEIEGEGASVEKSPILVVDDDRDTCEMICVFLSSAYDCDTALSGDEALAKVSAKNYAVVISDLLMPGTDGFGVIEFVAARTETTPVIVITGVSETESAIKAMKMGAFDYILKPFDIEQLEVSVKRAYGHHIIAEAARRYERRLAEYAAGLEKANDGLRKALEDLDDMYHSAVAALASALEVRDVETQGHSDRVVAYSLRLGQEIGLDAEELKALEMGALFHDIGKIGIKDSILLKPAHLTKEEWREMRSHPQKGAKIISRVPQLRPALPVVLQHHERWNGRGYPAGLTGDEIDLKARIFAVADAVDAITSDRPYSKARSFEAAHRELMRAAGKQFDPQIVETFCRVPLEEWSSLCKDQSSAG
jgi:response regulator RpfG family c-di-GMP phosphodiesterase